MIRLTVCLLVLAGRGSIITAVAASEESPQPTVGPPKWEAQIVRFDSGVLGGEVPLQAGPSLTSTNYLMKRFAIESLQDLQSAELQIFAALRAPDGNFSWDRWKWIWFSLNGHQWVKRVEDVPLARTRGDVDWATMTIPNMHYLRKGVNGLTLWTQNPPEYGEAGRDKYLVMAFDNAAQSVNSFGRIDDAWTHRDLNGDREGEPRGEWMIRIKLNQHSERQRKIIDSLGPARYRKEVQDKAEFVWGFTDALHRVFPGQPYTEPLGTTWTIDVARNEYESCQLAIVPVSVDIEMAEVFAGDFVPVAETAGAVRIPRANTTVRLVRTARAAGVDWPDPLPHAYPMDIARGSVQVYWISVHVPEDRGYSRRSCILPKIV
ncbi:MAG: hypothetical protein CMJ59_14825, partial [Planctomycetaceae bacterium]|nr:hypothetical protein [Planctomycetaceae bacterium]